jgi:hypothetical protein
VFESYEREIVQFNSLSLKDIDLEFEQAKTLIFTDNDRVPNSGYAFLDILSDSAGIVGL